MITQAKDLFFGFNFPKTNEQEVLLTLITQGRVSLFDFPVMAGYRTRISDLQKKHNLHLKRVLNQRFNKFGNSYTYAIYKLDPENLQQAIDIYKKIND